MSLRSRAAALRLGRAGRGDLANRPVIITGGGTAGHTNPGIAVAQALVETGVPRNLIHFVGGSRGNEGTLVGDAGFTIDLLPGRGIQRKPTFDNIGAVSACWPGSSKGSPSWQNESPGRFCALGGTPHSPRRRRRCCCGSRW